MSKAKLNEMKWIIRLERLKLLAMILLIMLALYHEQLWALWFLIPLAAYFATMRISYIMHTKKIKKMMDKFDLNQQKIKKMFVDIKNQK